MPKLTRDEIQIRLTQAEEIFPLRKKKSLRNQMSICGFGEGWGGATCTTASTVTPARQGIYMLSI